ncbi:50S ribosomal protein L35 [Dethiobacter alkaliphilus]|uniref:Large ribosomal subunit protein bL35 n=1 Tax=Dethiobacter alkaliphilus AHT 1 TaxID=555088 RepID=C0GJM9_DETAL|nr:50S ribosomal protein L35 [Dethiobacter alkaliphilus]EEG76451.1 ribosomal protein L35 [Dethiobacter alkaliphilus AHT 1]MCW3491183.1 50S ribosomal protein L35 [Dethiobacter alkaliphilus]
MPKMKTHSGAAKRFKKTGSGKYKRSRANHSHILEKKAPKRKRRLRKNSVVCAAETKRLDKMLPY